LDRSKTDSGLLLRLRETGAQVSLDRRARQANVKGAFGIEPLRAAELRGKAVMLVDDVMTSGASLYAAAHAVRQAGATRLAAAVLARTDEPG
jgi:predicted amidophosphoribosyltransferase